MSSPLEPNMTTRKFNQLLVSLGVTITLLTNAYPQASRTVMVQSNTGVLLFPTNLFTANASSARSGLSLAAHATNPIVPVTSGGSGATNVGGARTNYGLGWSALTNTNAATSLLGFTTNGDVVAGTNVLTFMNNVRFSGGDIQFNTTQIVGNGLSIDFDDGAIGGVPITLDTNSSIAFLGAAAATTRTNLGLPLAALTNTSTSSFRSAVGLGATWLTNTDASNFRTAVGLGATNNVQFNTVRVTGTGSPTDLGVFLGASNGLWGSSGPPSVGVGINGTTRLYVSETAITASAPIGFDNTTNSATTRTNLGLGATWLTNTNVTNFRTAIGLGATNAVTFQSASVAGGVVVQEITLTPFGIDAAPWGGGQIDFEEMQFFGNGDTSWDFGGSGIYNAGAFAFANTTNAATTRANLGLGLQALTNTNNANFQGAIFSATNAAPTNTTNVNAWVDIQVGTNSFKMPLYK